MRILGKFLKMHNLSPDALVISCNEHSNPQQSWKTENLKNEFKQGEISMKLSHTLAAAGMVLLAGATLAASDTPLRVAGNFSQNITQVEIERTFFNGLSEATGVGISMNYNPMDVVGVKAPDALRMLRGGSFDVMSVQIGMASRDDPFFEAST